MPDFNSKIGRTIQRRRKQEHIIWLTTVDAHETPQPRPVWFHWDGETVLILSQSAGAKVRHITRHPRVALNFNTDSDGGAVGVIIGEAQILREPVEPERMKAYLRKYKQGIQSLGMTPEGMTQGYSIAICVTPHSIRGM